MAVLAPRWKRKKVDIGEILSPREIHRRRLNEAYEKARDEFAAITARHKAARLANFTASNNGVLGQLLGIEQAKPYEKGIF